MALGEREKYYVGLLRDACAAALRNSEDFDQLLFVFEKMGCDYSGTVDSLGGNYQGELIRLAKMSPLACALPRRNRIFHTPFTLLYEKMFRGRNDLMHQGVAARQLTVSAVLVALVLQDALMKEATLVSDFKKFS